MTDSPKKQFRTGGEVLKHYVPDYKPSEPSSTIHHREKAVSKAPAARASELLRDLQGQLEKLPLLRKNKH